MGDGTSVPTPSRSVSGTGHTKTEIATGIAHATPSTWTIVTDRGETKLILKGEEDIRRLAAPALLIADSNGIQYLIRDRQALDAHSRKILDRFL